MNTKNLQNLPTWTNDQLQTQLDKWTAEIEQGGEPDMRLVGAYSFEQKKLQYTLHFDLNKIELSKKQSEQVIQWLDEHYIQCDRNRKSRELREKQFAGFAKAVVDEIYSMVKVTRYWDETEMRKIIARRAFDLVLYALYNIDPHWFQTSTNHEIVQYIPDLPVLPKEKE
jgi:hypothetical protein